MHRCQYYPSPVGASSSSRTALPASAENARRLVAAEAEEVADVVKYRGRNEDQAVEAVEQAAVAGGEDARVLDAEVAFDRGEHQVAELADDADDDAQRHQPNRLIQHGAGEDEVTEAGDECRSKHQRSKRAADGLVGAGVRRELASAKGFAG